MFDDIAPAKMAAKLDMVSNDNDLQWSFPESTQLIPGLQWLVRWLLNQLKHHTENVSSKVVHGIPVVLHQDKSDPIVSVAIQYGVGSNREKTGRTGFAHLFEHMLFQESENVAQDQFFKKIQDAGGTLNGGTWKDGTIYYEVVPKNAMETVMWMESDRMGFFINTVTAWG